MLVITCAQKLSREGFAKAIPKINIWPNEKTTRR
jgi:hypothetical protein